MSDLSLSRQILLFAAIAGATGVLLGAFGAHGLESFLESRGYDAALVAKRCEQYEVGIRYHLLHAAALFALAALPFGSTRLRCWVSRLFVMGLLLFSGSLYLLVLTDTPKLGMVTPIGGVVWILSWLLLIPLAVRKSED